MSNALNRRQFLATTAAGLALTATEVGRTQEAGADVVIVEKGRSEYAIVRPLFSSHSQVYAAEELQRLIREMTGVELPIRTDDDPMPGKAILLGDTAYTADLLGGQPDFAALGADGFRVVTRDDQVCVLGGAQRGTLYGVYELLERYWGCRWYSSFHSIIPQHERLVLDAIDDTQLPAFAMREPYWWEMRDGDFAARCRANGNAMQLEERHGGKIRFGGGLFVHTFYRLVPPSEFFEDHPEYFSLIDGERRIGWSQLCLTNPDVLRIVTERVLEAIRSDPGAKLFSVSQNDWDGHCQCESCMEIEEREESPAGPLIHFVNQVAEAVEREYPDVWIETLAYQYTRKPPKTIRPRHNVVPRLCTIECDFSLPLDESPYPQNVRFVDDIRGWSAITDKLYVWDYTTNFHNFVGPHPNFPAIPENIRFFRDNRVVGLFEQGNNQGPHGEFGELRAWLIAKLLWNPDQPVEPLLDDFFQGYYGAAAGPIREYFDEVQTLALDPEIDVRIFGSMRNDWLTMDFIERAEALWAEAESLAAGDSDLLYRVRMSGLCVLWARLKLTGDPEPVFELREGRLMYRGVDPKYVETGRELLRRVEEGDVRVREYTGYHQQEVLDIEGFVNGFALAEAQGAGAHVAVAPMAGAGAVRWSVGDGPNLVSPALGGVQITSDHRRLERADTTEFELVEASDGIITLRQTPPRAVWGPQTRERPKVERVVALDGGSLTIAQTYSMEEQRADVAPAIRVPLDVGGSLTLRWGDQETTLAVDGSAAQELPADTETVELTFGDRARTVRVVLPEGEKDEVRVTLTPDDGALLIAALPETRVGPESPLRVPVTLEAGG